MKNKQCRFCKGIDYNELHETLSEVYYLRGWKLKVYRFFMKHVYPDIEYGWQEHVDLIKQGHVAHFYEQR